MTTHPASDPFYLHGFGAWVLMRAQLLGVDILVDPALIAPVRVNTALGTIRIRPGMDDQVMHHWAGRSLAYLELGPSVCPEFVSRQAADDGVIPLLRRYR